MVGMTLEQVKAHLEEHKFVVLKYVRVAGIHPDLDLFRFAIPGYGPEHRDMVGKDCIPVSAAFVTIDVEQGTLVARGESSTLKMGPAADDEEKIKKLLGI